VNAHGSASDREEGAMPDKEPEYSPMRPAESALPIGGRDARVPAIFAPLLRAADAAQLAAATGQAMRSLGFDTFTYGAAIRLKAEWEPWYASWTTLPVEWIRRYHEMNYIDTDPRIIAGFGSPTPLIWDRSTLGGTPESEAFLADAARFGLRSGIVFHIPGPDAEHHMAAFNSARSDCDWIDDSIAGQAFLFASHFHRWFRDAMVGGRFEPGGRGQPLSVRERECLAYVARGLTNADIAKAMGITERTVGFHVSHLLVKLEAANRTEAVARALRERLLET
jgi:DNA-binding CsgD family transcriptional regulator